MDLLSPSSAAALVLLAFRVGGVVLIAPVFGSKLLPTMLRTSILVVLTWLLHPVALLSVQGPLRITPAQALAETMVGLAIGLGAAVLIAAAEATGDLMAVHMGLSGASAVDPLSNISVPVLGQFASLFAVTLMLSVDGHVVMLEALSSSLQLVPIGSEIHMRAGAEAMVTTGSTLFVLGLRFAAPVLATVLLATVALAILTRAAPTLNVLSVAFPIQITVGLFALAASIPAIAAFYNGWDAAYGTVANHLLSTLATGGAR